MTGKSSRPPTTSRFENGHGQAWHTQDSPSGHQKKRGEVSETCATEQNINTFCPLLQDPAVQPQHDSACRPGLLRVEPQGRVCRWSPQRLRCIGACAMFVALLWCMGVSVHRTNYGITGVIRHSSERPPRDSSRAPQASADSLHDGVQGGRASCPMWQRHHPEAADWLILHFC